MSIGERIRDHRKRIGMTQKELGAAIGIAANTVSDIERGKYEMGADLLGPLCAALGIAPSDVLDVSIPLPLSTSDWSQPLLAGYVKAPSPTQQNVCKLLDIPHVYPGKPAATPPSPPGKKANVVSFPALFADDDDVPEEEEMIVFHYPSAAGMPLYIESDYERIKFPYLAVPTKADFGVRIEGDSMEPVIHDGDIVWVYKTPDISDGQIGIFMLEDGAVCKKARLLPNGKLERLESINPEYDDITGSQLRCVRCVGRVLRSYTPEDYA